MLRIASALIALVLATSLAGPAAAAAYDEGLSHPTEDSYYPTKGDPGIDTLHYSLDLTWLRKRRVLNGTATIDLRATKTADGFQLDLAKPLTVGRVTVDGVPASFTHPVKTLHIAFPVVADSRHTVKVTYRGSPKPAKAPTTRSDFSGVGWHTKKDGQVWAMQEPYGAFTWYPSNDQPSDKALYDVRIDAPGEWVGVSNGRMTDRHSGDGRTITTFTNRDPMASYLMTIAVGPYERHHQTGPRGLPMNYWVPRGHPGMVKPLLHTPDAVRWLESKLGRYPFDRVGVVVTPSDSAMETQTMITLGAANYIYHDRDVRQTVLHELAHSWYGDTVTPRDWRDVWMNEGMAMYQEIRYAAHKGWTRWRVWQRQWARDDQLWRDLYGPPGNYHRGQFASINVYYCPALMLDRLRLKIGNHTFNQLVRRWPQEHLNTNQSRHSYVDWLEAKTGREFSTFFHRWLMSQKSPA